MLCITCPLKEHVYLTLQEDLPAGTQLRFTPLTTHQEGVRMSFDMPPAVSITRQGAKVKEPKARAT